MMFHYGKDEDEKLRLRLSHKSHQGTMGVTEMTEYEVIPCLPIPWQFSGNLQ